MCFFDKIIKAKEGLMTLKNAFKLSFLNLDKVWKLVLYRIAVWAIIIGLMSPCFFMVRSSFDKFITSETVQSFMLSGAFYTGTVSGVCNAFITSLFDFIVILATDYVGVLIYYIFLLFILLPTLMNMGKYTINAMMYGYMSSHTKSSFCTTYIGSFGKAFMFGFLRSLLNIVFNLSVIALFYLFINVPDASFEYVMPYIFVLVASLILTIKQLMIMGWATSMIVCGISSVKGFGFGIKTTFRRLGISFATCFLAYFLSLFALLGFGLYALFAIVPLFVVFIVMSESIVFFGNHGMKYYVDQDTIIAPKKHEELDKINQIKFLL
jgi:hypothetical protein